MVVYNWLRNLRPDAVSKQESKSKSGPLKPGVGVPPPVGRHPGLEQRGYFYFVLFTVKGNGRILIGTWSEDRATQGCDPSADQALEW
jgi:hypothetical protein